MKNISITLDEKEIELLTQICNEQGKNRSEVIRAALHSYANQKINTEMQLLQKERELNELQAVSRSLHFALETTKESAIKQSEMYEKMMQDKENLISEKQRTINRIDTELCENRERLETALNEAGNYKKILQEYSEYGILRRMLFGVSAPV